MDKLPVDIRYFATIALSWLASYLYQKGWIGDTASFQANALALITAATPLAIWFYARWIRPSNAALITAAQVDKTATGEAGATTNVISTPAGQPDVKVTITPVAASRGGQG